MARYCAYRLLLLRSPPTQFPNVKELVMASIKKFAVTQLRDPQRSNDFKVHIHEDQYQKEMYRVLFNFGILISPEYIIKPLNEKRLGEGRLDFKLGESNWAIELVRQDNDLQGHIDRFLPKGQYYREVVSGDGIKDWVVVNLTHTSISKIPKIQSMSPSSAPFIGYLSGLL